MGGPPKPLSAEDSLLCCKASCCGEGTCVVDIVPKVIVADERPIVDVICVDPIWIQEVFPLYQVLHDMPVRRMNCPVVDE